MNSYRFDGIQALRFLAAIMVVITHSFFYASERLGAGELSWSAGAKGVDIFFVISGFVMVITSQKFVNFKGSWKDFLTARLIRIVPLYWTATTVKLVVLLLMSSVVLHANFDWWMIFKSYFFVPSRNIDGEIRPFLGVGWTLVFEMFFYLVFTTALLFRKNIYIFVGVFLFIFSLLSIYKEDNYSPWWYLMDPIILEFYFGMIIGYFTLNNKYIPHFFSAAILLPLALAYLFLSKNTLYLPRIVENGIPAAILVWSVISLEVYLQGKIPRPVMFFGAASYALYLFHPLIAPLAPEVLKRMDITNFSLSVSFSIIIAMTTSAVIFRYFEQPLTSFLRKKNRTSAAIHSAKIT